MHSPIKTITNAGAVLAIAAHIGLASAAPTDAEQLFTLKVGPVLSLKCNGCHGDDPEKIKGGLNMLTRETLLKGGEELGSELHHGALAGWYGG